MKRFLHLLTIIALLLIGNSAAVKAAYLTEQKIDPELRYWMQEDTAAMSLNKISLATYPIIVYLTRQADLEQLEQAKAGRNLTLTEKRKAIVNALLFTAAQTQKSVLNQLPALRNKSLVESFWIFNGFSITADTDTIYSLAASAEVAHIYPNRVIQNVAKQNQFRNMSLNKISLATSPTLISETPTPPLEITETPTPPPIITEWGISQMQADKVWSELNITGKGVVVGSIDSGVMWEHNALKSKYRGWDGTQAEHRYSWFDVVNQRAEPYDDQGHGTHTMGSMVGSTAEEEIGVAPGATWISVKALDDHGSGLSSTLLKGMEWMLAPGGDPSMAPDVVSNSWGARTCEDTFRTAVKAWQAANIIAVFSAGNNGTMGSSTIGSPACYPEVIGVGATNDKDQVADFSSQGPSAYGGIKPDVSAPGVNIRSSSNNGEFGNKSGTSMATPYISGVIALILSADPTLTPQEVITILKNSAVDVDDAGEDNRAGAGRVDALAAVKAVLAKNQTQTPTGDSSSATPTIQLTYQPPVSPTILPTPTIQLTYQPPVSPTILPTPTIQFANQPSATPPIQLTYQPSVSPPTQTSIRTSPLQQTATPPSSPTNTSFPTPQQERSNEGNIIMDDSFPSFGYGVGWKVMEHPSFYQGGSHFSDTFGSNLALSFEGEGITLLNTYAPTYGILYLMIDGKFGGNINLYAPTIKYQQKWSSLPLAKGKHWIKLIHYSGELVNIDAIIISKHPK